MVSLKEKEIKTEKLNIKNTHWKIKLVLIIISLFAIWEGVTALAKPTLIALCKVKSQSLAASISSKVVQDVMNGLGYLDLITLDRDEKGNILALRANVIEMNRLSSKINNMIQEEYSNLNNMYVKIPIGNFTGNELLARSRSAADCKNYSSWNSEYRL
ncbi:MAG: hypothetical protein IJ220_00645 [Clostridia bacterium]|nr:hypothetical protein [Clostridia bacterium]